MGKHKGTQTFIIQRASAVIILPFAVWFLFSMVSQLGAGYDAARAWLGQPVNGVLFGAFLIVAAWHMRIGMAEIIADYIHSWLKPVFVIVNWAAALGVTAAAAWSVYSISFAG